MFDYIMGYCATCNDWCGYSTSFCELPECELTRKLIGLYGIKKIGEALEKIFVRNEKAIENRTDNIEKIKEEPTRYNLRTNKD